MRLVFKGKALTLCPFVRCKHTTVFQLPAQARHIAFTQTNHGGSSMLHRIDVTATNV